MRGVADNDDGDGKSALVLDWTSAQGEGSSLSYKWESEGADAECDNEDDGVEEGRGWISWIDGMLDDVAASESVDVSGGGVWGSIPGSSAGKA